MAQTLINRAFDSFLSYVYNTEDTLYQILYDKAYRPEVYKLKTGHSQQTANINLNNFTISKPEQDAVTFIETRFLEQINSTRIGLI